jgi:hypothetical protein
MLRNFPVLASAALLGATLVSASTASAAVIRTASFETPILNAGGIQYGPDEAATYNTNAVGPVVIPNFTFSGFSGIIKNGASGVFPDTSFGTQAAFLQSYNGTGSTISWAINGLTVGQTYTLSFYDVAASAAIAPGENFTVSAFGSAALPYTPIASYRMDSFDFVASSSSGSIDFTGLTIPTGNFATAIDNIQISTIPEPVTLSLFGIGLAGAAAMRRRRTKQA